LALWPTGLSNGLARHKTMPTRRQSSGGNLARRGLGADKGGEGGLVLQVDGVGGARDDRHRESERRREPANRLVPHRWREFACRAQDRPLARG